MIHRPLSRVAVRALALALPTLALVQAASASDLTIVSEVTVGKKTTSTTQYVSEGKIRTADDRFDTILDYRSGSILHIDHRKKRYSETNLEEMRAHFEELEAMLEQNPILGQMLGEATAIEVTRRGDRREIAGYDCARYTLTMGQSFAFEIWATPDLEVPVSYYDARKMAYATVGPFASRFDRMFEEMKKIDGFALRTDVDVKLMGMGIQSTSEAVEVRRGSIPEAAFEIPAGYKKQKSAFK